MRIGFGLTVALALSGAAEAATLLNGSFEQNSGSGGVGVGGTALTNWEVLGPPGASIDVVVSNPLLWTNFDGDFAVDLSGLNIAASIRQTITDLIVGQDYVVRFALGGNFYDDPTVKSLDVIGPAGAQSYSFDTTGSTVFDMGWTIETYRFTAATTSAPITFAGLDNTGFGAVIDAVSVQAVPLPAAALFLLTGLGALGMVARRRSRGPRGPEDDFAMRCTGAWHLA